MRTPPESSAHDGWHALRQAMIVLVAAPVLAALHLGEVGAGEVEWAIPELPEPSGIVWHPIRKTLFVVGDEGDIGELSPDGKMLHTFHLGGDLEAISVDPKSGLLFVAREGHEVIFEIRPDNFRIVRRFTIDRSFGGDPNFLRRGGDGVEGLTYVVDDSDPEGGHLWVVNQYDPPVLVELAIPMRSSKEAFLVAKIRRAIPIDSAPLSEVTWMPASREFLVLSALWKRVSVLDANGNTERSVRIPGFMPEGIAKLPDGRFAIAQDSGGVLVWNPANDPFRGDGVAGPPLPERSATSTDAAPVAATGAAPVATTGAAPVAAARNVEAEKAR